MDLLSSLICLFSAPAFIFPSFIVDNNPNDRTQGRSRRGFTRYASHDDQTDLGRFPVTGCFLQAEKRTTGTASFVPDRRRVT
jgi:hypothetical protein